MSSYGMIVVDTIEPRIDLLLATAPARARAVMEGAANAMEAAARANAEWNDRTGEARSGLTAGVFDDGGEVVLELYHEAEHGYWLEIIQDGRFAVIMPTLEAFGPQALEAAGRAVVGVDGPG